MALATPIIACTYAEIALKGRNRKVFLRKLINNINIALKGEPVEAVKHVESRLLVHLSDPGRAPEVTAKLKNVFGIQWLSPVVVVPREDVDVELREDVEAERTPRLTRICAVAAELATEARGEAANFKVETRRSDRAFILKSPEVSAEVGAAVHQAIGLPGKMSHPDLTVNVLVLKDNVLVFTGKEPAYGGLPLAEDTGTSGRRVLCGLRRGRRRGWRPAPRGTSPSSSGPSGGPGGRSGRRRSPEPATRRRGPASRATVGASTGSGCPPRSGARSSRGPARSSFWRSRRRRTSCPSCATSTWSGSSASPSDRGRGIL